MERLNQVNNRVAGKYVPKQVMYALSALESAIGCAYRSGTGVQDAEPNSEHTLNREQAPALTSKLPSSKYV